MFVVSGMSFANFLECVSGHEVDIVVVRITKHDLGSVGEFEIAAGSNKSRGSPKQYIALGRFSCRMFALTQPNRLGRSTRSQAKGVLRRSWEELHSSSRTRVLYESGFTRVVRNSPDYQSLIYLSRQTPTSKGLARSSCRQMQVPSRRGT